MRSSQTGGHTGRQSQNGELKLEIGPTALPHLTALGIKPGAGVPHPLSSSLEETGFGDLLGGQRNIL